MSYKFNPFTAKFDLVKPVAGNTTEVQYNDEGAFAADSEFIWNNTTKELKATNIIITNNFKNYNPDLTDMGLEKTSDLRGYANDYITDKSIANCNIGYNVLTVNGGFRVDSTQDPDKIEIYLEDAWRVLLYDTIVDYGDLRHTPIDNQIYVWRGDSVLLGLNGRPTVQEYDVSMGAYPPARIIDGGTF